MGAATVAPALEQRRRRRLWAVTILLLMAFLGGAQYWHRAGQHWSDTNDAYVTGNITPIKAQTAGYVAAVLVDNTEYVHQGQVLIRMQGDRARVAVEQAAGDLAEAARKVSRLVHVVGEDKAQLAAVQAKEAKLRHDLVRYRRAAPGQGVAAQTLQNAADQLAVLQRQEAAARARLAADTAMIRDEPVAHNPLVTSAAARYIDAWIAQQRQEVRAPIAGFVAQREVYPGMPVSAGAHLLDIVPLDDLWVVANVKETHMARVRPGQRVVITADYYGTDVSYTGVVQGLAPESGDSFSALPPQNTTGNYIHIVERVPVRIALDPAELARHPLRPGLSVVARIDLGSRGGALNAPLTVTPEHNYRTDIYAHQLEQARHLAAQIVRANS